MQVMSPPLPPLPATALRQSVSQNLILPFICLRTNVLGRLIATATYLPEDYLRLRLRFAKPRFEDSAALIGGPLSFPAPQG
jgi:hypothetical protein